MCEHDTILDQMRDLIIASGYYGFDNLGDEAILEELVAELKKLSDPQNIIVLSANPAITAKKFGVRSELRTDLVLFSQLCTQARLFVSGGGGLFQNTKSLGSVMFYALQIMVAKAKGASVMIYAQGIGPLRGAMANWITRRAFTHADAVAVRDSASKALLDQWGVPAEQTADPVWCLESRRLPPSVETQLNAIAASKLIALSLRTSHNFSDAHLDALVQALKAALPETAHILLLPLQMNQDKELLEKFGERWRAKGGTATFLDTTQLLYPSQWISLFGRCKLVVGMRLHALIMALKAGVGVAGIAYDPKVEQVLKEFEQPILILAKEPPQGDWEQLLKTAVADSDRLAHKAMRKAEGAKKLACQNFQMLARILGMQTS
jgi:polysaccharide pyruvyl transferase CsaB